MSNVAAPQKEILGAPTHPSGEIWMYAGALTSSVYLGSSLCFWAVSSGSRVDETSGGATGPRAPTNNFTDNQQNDPA